MFSEGAREQPSLSILPRPEIERCGPRTRGVMVKRSDAERKGRGGGKKNRKWPWEGLQKKKRDVNKEIKRLKKRGKKAMKKNKDEGEKRKIKGADLMSRV